ncbi:16S rRNA (cytosine(1402)-N(4))-methyltransferase RsmH [Williamsia deligens]|uniref:Ribosomal RNA small subunit methyltransferase H n=1 Tax=Williamsia deligens TaxID=321325 RepID=A0ABW3G929_9NOCA|nr:16S rRNA (cytosine(1402)-N(4))-methyltransferase RsmH [Williamsia deligens]MCP2195862.1 16S rRNA (cytosine1402-N4)-methyltransferase [Williamsia deligens]
MTISGEHGHVPVMAHRMLELVTPSLTRRSTDGAGAVFVDGTLGAGGHTELILQTFPAVHVVALDRDASAIEGARERLSRFADRLTIAHRRYDAVDEVLAEEGIDAVDAALYDLGVSSMQLDRPDRGFAYAVDAPLDMRMDTTDGPTAADVLNTYEHGDLARVLSTYGEERFAGKIASAVLRERAVEPFTTSGRLVELLYRVIPAATRRTGGHPAKRTFQALRIEVNRELESLESAVPRALDALGVGGRLVVMSYQSLEDRIVKREFAQRTTSSTPPGLPFDLPGTAPLFTAVTRGAERADAEELERNPRSAPVRLRAVERIATP